MASRLIRMKSWVDDNGGRFVEFLGGGGSQEIYVRGKTKENVKIYRSFYSILNLFIHGV